MGNCLSRPAETEKQNEDEKQVESPKPVENNTSSGTKQTANASDNKNTSSSGKSNQVTSTVTTGAVTAKTVTSSTAESKTNESAPPKTEIAAETHKPKTESAKPKPEPEPEAEAKAEAEPAQAEEAQTEEVPTEEVQTEEVQTEEVQTEEVQTEEAQAEEPKEEEPKEEPKAEEQKAEEQKAEEQKTEEPIQEKDTEVEEEKTMQQMTVRYEIRSMSESDQNRFVDAILKMCENKSDPGTSEYFRLAGYHGLPGPYYCAHGRETFPGWHRVYLREFEKALQAADRALGRDGNICLPYWDWSTNPNDGLPAIVRKRFSEWPQDLFPADFKIGKLQRADDKQITKSILSYQVAQEALDCMLSAQHFTHASTGNEWASKYPSLESPHNSIHGIVGGRGGQMGNVGYAAFDLVFWLHHCNIDRIYAGYLQAEPDSQQEFESHQEHAEKDLFDSPFEPFRKEDGTPYYPKDTFHTAHLNYKYDKIPPRPAAQLREAPQLVVFPQVRVDQFESKCYQIHVFVLPKEGADDIQMPTTLEEVLDHLYYAGSRSIFGRGSECKNCIQREPYDIIVDVSDKLRTLRLSRHKAVVKVLLVETTSSEPGFVDMADTALPQPILTGPLFEDKHTHLNQEQRQTQPSEEVSAMQRYLKRFGYYNDTVDGDFGPITETAVKTFQRINGLNETGSVDADTKHAMTQTKRCSNVDGFTNSGMKDEESLAVDYGDKIDLTYSVGVSPGYLHREDVLACIQSVTEQWCEVCNITMTYIDMYDEKSSDADIWYEWSDQKLHQKNVMRFDGNGGVLGEGGNGFVVFDHAERWVIGVDDDLKMTRDVSSLEDPQTWYGGQPTISLYHTALHETGHALGLDHSHDWDDLMAPFYNPERTTLTEADKRRASEAWRS